jgi:carbon storage regulator
MLVLTRKKAETIVIGDSIVIKVIACGNGRTKIGIDAPVTTRVLRGEVINALNRHSPEIAEATSSELVAH